MNKEEKRINYLLDIIIECPSMQADELRKRIRRLFKRIEKQQKEIEEQQKKLDAFIDDIDLSEDDMISMNRVYFNKNYISKDKIREKMEYYTELYKQDNSPNDFLISQGCLSKLSLLQELLGEENE